MKMQRLFLLLSVTILLLAGCGRKKQPLTEEQSVETETQTEWAMRDKNDQERSVNEEAIQAYEAFLHGELATDEGEYLTDLFGVYIDDIRPWDGYVDGINYSYLDLGADGVQELLITFIGMDIYYEDDNSTYNVVLRYDGSVLQKCYEYECWARSNTEISYYGIVKSGGSGGATSGMFDMGVLDAEGNFEQIYVLNVEVPSEVSSYLDYHELFSGQDICNDWESMPSMAVYLYQIGNDYYVTYDDTYPQDEIAQFISFFNNYGYDVYSLSDIESIIQGYESRLGVSEQILSDEIQVESYTLESQYYSK